MIVADSLDENDMVCDFKAVKAALKTVVDKYDHAIYLNSNDRETIEGLGHASERIIIMEDRDPTSEVLAKLIFDELTDYISGGKKIESGGNVYSVRPDILLERVRVWETSTSWVEYEHK